MYSHLSHTQRAWHLNGGDTLMYHLATVSVQARLLEVLVGAVLARQQRVFVLLGR